MTELCCALFKYENERKIDCPNLLTTLYFTKGTSWDGHFHALHLNWLSRRHQFSSIPASTAEVSMVSPTCIMLALPFLKLFLISSVCVTSCVEVWQNMRPGDVSSPHFLVGAPIMRLHEASFTFTNDFWSPTPGGLLEDFSWFILLNASASCLRLPWGGQ